MNIIYLDTSPVLAARYQTDDGVAQAILDTHDLLKLAHTRLKSAAHPCEKWVCASLPHYLWLAKHFGALLSEYRQRRNFGHSYELYLLGLTEAPNLPRMGWTAPPQCMKECYRQANTVLAYRAYYAANYLGEEKPKWKETT